MTTKVTDSAIRWLSLWLIPGLGPRRIDALWRHFKTIDNILNASPAELSKVEKISKTVAELIPKAMENPRLEKELSLIEKLNLKLTDFTHPDYSSALLEIYDVPPVLYQMGEIELNKNIFLAFVGSRKSTYAGKNFCKKLIMDLASMHPGIVVVSGLALGVDTAAHQAALEAGLKTVAVLAGGLSTIYPPQNRALSQQITTQGALISEFPITTRPVAANFPLRNRIISGLSHGVVIVEAGKRSGALITAGYALEQNRELFSVPGPPNSQHHEGTNRLIQKGNAKLIMNAEDILEEIMDVEPIAVKESKKSSNKLPDTTFNEREIKVLKLLKEKSLPQDILSRTLRLSIPELLATLTTLEMKEAIICKPGSLYEVVPPFSDFEEFN